MTTDKNDISSLLPKTSRSSISGNSARVLAGERKGQGSSSNTISDDWTRFGKRQLLSIGGGRSRHRHYDDDDAAGGAGHDSICSSEEEEEGGRTSAVRERRKKQRVQSPLFEAATAETNTATDLASGRVNVLDVAVSESMTSKKKTKKKGKKERVMEANAEMEPSSHAPSTTKTDLAVDANVYRVKDPTGDDNVDASIKKKRYTKKVRSRQKNIRKDRRAVADRPIHLVMGGGRPLTQATKQKLGLHSITTTTSKDNNVNPSSAIDTAFASGVWVGDGGDGVDDGDKRDGGADSHPVRRSVSTEHKSTRSVSSSKPATLTKVGDCIVDRDMISEQPDKRVKKLVVVENSSNKTMGKNRKRKFKNIP